MKINAKSFFFLIKELCQLSKNRPDTHSTPCVNSLYAVVAGPLFSFGERQRWITMRAVSKPHSPDENCNTKLSIVCVNSQRKSIDL